MSTSALPTSELTAEELAERVGAVPLGRIRRDPSPGSACEADVERVLREEDRICELIDGVLVEKAVSDLTAFLAIELATLLNAVVRPQQLGWVLGADGFVHLGVDRMRAPDVSFVRRDQRPQGLLAQGYANVAPALAVEVFAATCRRFRMRKAPTTRERNCPKAATSRRSPKATESPSRTAGPESLGPGAVSSVLSFRLQYH